MMGKTFHKNFLPRILWVVLGGSLFFGNGLQAQSRSDSTRNRLSLAFEIHSSSRFWDGGIHTSVGARWNRHELGFHIPNYIDPYSFSFGGHYRFYLDRDNPIANPFFAIQGVPYHKIEEKFVLSGNDPIGAFQKGIYGQLGADYRIKGGFSGLVAIGYGSGWMQIEDRSFDVWQAYHPDFTFGFKYDLLLKKSRQFSEALPEDYSDRTRFFLSYRLYVPDIALLTDSPPPELRPSHQFTAEFGIWRWFRLQGGIKVGYLAEEVTPPVFTAQGVGFGVKLHTYQRGNLSFFHDLMYYRLNRPRFNYDQSQILIGNSFEYQVLPDFYVHAGNTFGFRRFNSWFNFHAGVSIGLGKGIFR